MFELIYGDVGSGKTLYMTMLLEKYKQNGLNIMSNYCLNFEYKLMTDEDIKNYEKWEYNGLAIGIDEIHVYCDSRLPTKKSNRIIGYWFTQSRKRNCHIFGTTQFIRQVDLRLRGVVDFLTRCTAYKLKPKAKHKKYNTGFEKGTKPCEMCNYFEKDEDTIECYCTKKKKRIMMNTKSCEHFILPDVYVQIEKLHVYSGTVTTKMFYANPYFEKYDTTQIIKPIQEDEQ